MSAARGPTKRLQKEISDFQAKQKKGENGGVKAELVGENLFKWRGIIDGPEDSPYAGGKFVVYIDIPEDYPYNPPKMKFDTKVWHPNISSQTGAICLDILGKEWSPALSIRTALISLAALFTSAEPDDPQDAEVATQYKSDRPAYDAKAKKWTEEYAKDPDAARNEQVTMVTAMGFSEEQARAQLEKSGWDANAAVEALLSGAGAENSGYPS